jgi:hypothetical protein
MSVIQDDAAARDEDELEPADPTTESWIAEQIRLVVLEDGFA